MPIHSRFSFNAVTVALTVINTNASAEHGLLMGVWLLSQDTLGHALVQLAGQVRTAIVFIREMTITLNAVKHAETCLVRIQFCRGFQLLALVQVMRIIMTLVVVELARTRSSRTAYIFC